MSTPRAARPAASSSLTKAANSASSSGGQKALPPSSAAPSGPFSVGVPYFFHKENHKNYRNINSGIPVFRIPVHRYVIFPNRCFPHINFNEILQDTLTSGKYLEFPATPAKNRRKTTDFDTESTKKVEKN